MSVEVRAQNTISMTSVKAIKDATDQSAQLLAEMEEYAEDAGTTLTGIYQVAKDAETSASNAQTSADNAQASADMASDYASRALGNLSTVQSVAETLAWITQHGTMTLTSDVAIDPTHIYFVQDAQGDYVVGGTHYAIVSEPDVADLSTYYELSIDESLNNYVGTHLALDNEGLWLLPATNGTNKVLIATGAGTTYTTAGTYLIDNSGTVVASFRTDGTQIGKASLMHIDIDEDSFIMVDTQSTEIAHIGSPATPEVTDTFYFDGLNRNFTLSHTPVANPTIKINGTTTTAYTRSGKNITIQVSAGMVKGDIVTATYTTTEEVAFYTFGKRAGNAGKNSFAEGTNTTASGKSSHAEGGLTMAVGEGSHAEGNSTKAYGLHSHAEGFSSTASERYGHAEGYYAKADGIASHAQNSHTIAGYEAQTVIGKYNDNQATTALEIGNGANNARSNALTVDWSGNVVASGDITDGYGNTLSNVSVNSTDVPTADTIAEFDSTAHMNSTDMTAQEVSDFVDGVGGGTGAFADKVIEQGTDGIWTYRKWESGISECWGVKQFSANLNNQYGGIYWGDTGAVTFPTGLFIAMPNAEASVDLMGGVGGCTFNTVSASGIDHIYAFNGVSYNYTNRYLHIHAIGKWK